MATEDDMTSLNADITKEVDEAYAFAVESPLPEPAEALEDVFV